MKLYKVEVSFDMVVLAKDEKDARHVADSHAREELSNALGAIDYVEEITDPKQIPSLWRGALPYTAKDDADERTIEQWLAAFKEEAEERDRKNAHRKEPYLPGLEPKE